MTEKTIVHVVYAEDGVTVIAFGGKDWIGAENIEYVTVTKEEFFELHTHPSEPYKKIGDNKLWIRSLEIIKGRTKKGRRRKALQREINRIKND